MAFKRQKCPEFERLCASEGMSHGHAVGMDGEEGREREGLRSRVGIWEKGSGMGEQGAGMPEKYAEVKDAGM